LSPVLGPLAEDALIGSFADERDRARIKLCGETLETLSRAGEVRRAKIARAARRATGGVRQPDAERE
jgi:hypothetical protein